MSAQRGEWFPYFERRGFKIPVARREFWDFAGSGYKFARKNGKVVKFWFRKNAQKYADALNKQEGIESSERG